jgi:hypothetical protein
MHAASHSPVPPLAFFSLAAACNPTSGLLCPLVPLPLRIRTQWKQSASHERLIVATYFVPFLAAAGYTARDLAESGLFPASELLAAGFSIEDLAELDPDLARSHEHQLLQQAAAAAPQQEEGALPEEGEGSLALELSPPDAGQQVMPYSPLPGLSHPSMPQQCYAPMMQGRAAYQQPMGVPEEALDDEGVDVDELLSLLGV